mmetsp:Transcript_46976/g.130508  ORF Transcript_46976/g.130508 Transcript_46976/m.130508 type:complete len:314 (-) Transcript_46976:57-998(-)
MRSSLTSRGPLPASSLKTRTRGINGVRPEAPSVCQEEILPPGGNRCSRATAATRGCLRALPNSSAAHRKHFFARTIDGHSMCAVCAHGRMCTSTSTRGCSLTAHPRWLLAALSMSTRDMMSFSVATTTWSPRRTGRTCRVPSLCSSTMRRTRASSVCQARTTPSTSGWTACGPRRPASGRATTSLSTRTTPRSRSASPCARAPSSCGTYEWCTAPRPTSRRRAARRSRASSSLSPCARRRCWPTRSKRESGRHSCNGSLRRTAARSPSTRCSAQSPVYPRHGWADVGSTGMRVNRAVRLSCADTFGRSCSREP